MSWWRFLFYSNNVAPEKMRKAKLWQTAGHSILFVDVREEFQ